MSAAAGADCVEERPAAAEDGGPPDGRRGAASAQRRHMVLSCAALALIAVVVLGLALRRSAIQAAGERPAVAATPALAALVAGVPVTMAAYQRQLRFATNGYGGPRAVPDSPTWRTIRRQLENKAVSLAIAEALIDHQATTHHVRVDDAAVSAEVGRMTAAAGGPAALNAQMRATGMGLADLRWVARHTLLRDRVGDLLHDRAWLDHMVNTADIQYFVGDGAAGPDRVPAVALDHPAPPFVAVDLRGRAVSLADLSGRAVVLNFWATWCRYCVDELPMLLRFARAHPAVAVVALDRQEDPGLVRAYLHQHRLEGLTVWLDVSGQAYLDYTLPGLPATFYIDRSGTMRGYNFGPLNDPASLAAGGDHAARGVDYTTYNP